MKHSETISALTESLAKAQGAFPAVQKSGENKHLGNQYSTLDDIIAAVRKPLAANGLSFLQPLMSLEDGALVLETILMHQSGEWVSSEVAVPSLSGNKAVNELQAFGSALTYMRRYTLTAMLGVTSEEDVDGNGAAGNGQKPKPAARPQQKKARSTGSSPKPTGESGNKPTPHWIEDPKIRARFWKWAREDLALSDVDVHAALNVKSIKDYPGTMSQAKMLIEAWPTGEAEDAV